ncbi:hypothetical protein ASN88_00758 [Streptococcus parauberis]|nr:hypothetical protein ASN88_00758 [Streptococcus parauberis]
MMTLSDVYLLKKSIIGLYDGDDYIVQYLLKKGYSTRSIVTRYYLFLSKDENRVMKELLKNVDLGSLIDFWQQSGTWVNALNVYIEKGVLLNSKKGFYLLTMEGG